MPKGWIWLCKQLDTVQEAWNYILHQAAADDLERCRQEAADLSDDGEGLAPYRVGGELLQVRSTGARGGFRWVAGNDDFLLMFKPGGAGWSITVRYLAAGLWEYGIDDLVERVKAILDKLGEPNDDDYRRLTRADIAYDFYAPGFAESATVRLAEGVLMPAKCKARTVTLPHLDKVTTFSRGGRIETLTLGSKSTLQVELYNKTLEITEASGKEWMYPIWEENGLPGAVRSDVWRLEIRFAKEWLQNRGIRRLSEFIEWQYALVREAVQSRRLTVPTNDSNRARWPLHPFWNVVQELTPVPFLAPRGRRVTARADAIKAQLIKMVGGISHSFYAIDNRGEDEISDVLALDRLYAAAKEFALKDPEQQRKLKRASERYRFIEEAR